MSSTYSANLRVTFQTTGENDSTWGDICNQQSLQLLESAICGSATFSLASADVTLTTNSGAADQARMAILLPTGVLAANRNIIVPAVSKFYLVYNNTSGAFTVTVKTPSGSGVTVTQGVTQWVWCNATNVLAVDAKTATLATLATTATDAVNVTTTIGGVAIASYARKDTSQAFTKSQYATPVTLTDGANIAVDASLSNIYRVTLAGNRTLDNPTNLTDGMQMTFYVKQDATGSRTLAYGTKYEFPDDVAPTLTTTASKMDVITGTYDSAGDKIFCAISKNYTAS